MARQDKAAFRYAKAAFDYLDSGKKAKSLAEELRALAGVIRANEQLTQVLESEAFSSEQRRPILEDLAKKLKLSADALKVALVISGARRLGALGAIAQKLHELVLVSEDIVPLAVQSPTELSEAEKEKVEKRFASLLGKKVEATYEVDASLLGGLRVSAAGRSYNGTLAGWLSAFQESLVEGTR